MKILHTADLHLGQIIYQSYERSVGKKSQMLCW